jgi:hypothetical protein
MAELHPEIASHSTGEGMIAVRLHGGPWDGKVVGVRNLLAPLIQVNGPRHGNHRVWITHLYEKHEDHYEFSVTEVIPISAWTVSFPAGPCGDTTSR